ncbi:ankyrin repeat domain containing protein [Fusarium agapanthi]|uniref:Ankyrin repeat domain containing protein n=1 Tax=Fusarium agapanthi TaxID=1803897 RepID=A0A9P5BHI0_9HYPO|nr:ankyrin repeat domain containing protein [Fusarium agapanthi]
MPSTEPSGLADLSSLEDAVSYLRLDMASMGGNVKIMPLLLASGADVELRNEEGWSPLMVAAERGHDEAMALLLNIVERLLNAGADPNAQDEAESLTAISWAAESGHEDVVKLLLERGAGPNAADRVLLSALRGCGPDDSKDRDALIQLLIKHGAGVFMDSWSNKRPLVIVTRQGQDLTVEIFLEASYSSRSVRQEHIWNAITLAAEEEGNESILASLMKHYELDEAEKQTKWEWVQESQFADLLELLRPYFEADAISEKGGKESN